MAAMTHLTLLLLLLIFTVQSSAWNLDVADEDAFRLVAEGLGLRGQTAACDVAGVHCSGGRITRIVLRSRRLSGHLSPAIGRLSELVELSLSDNELAGQVPAQMGECRKLRVLDLRKNRLSGEVPGRLSSLGSLRLLDLSSNRFVGELGLLRHLRALESLSVADNLFTGKLPAELQSFRHLRRMNVTGNLLHDQSTGTGSAAIAAAAYINLAAPRRVRVLAENTPSVLAPAPQPAAGPRQRNSTTSGREAAAPGPSQTAHHKKRSSRRKKILSWILGFFVGALAGVFSGLLSSLLFRLLLNCIRRRRKTPAIEIFSPKIIKNAQDLQFLEREDGVADLPVIGRGACGEVYRAELPNSNGRLIAIKKISNPTNDPAAADADLNEEDSRLLHRRFKQIRSEIQTVGRIRHRNLLPLLAHVKGPNCHYLIYEFMKNGSLHDLMNKVSRGEFDFPWKLRLVIAQGIAEGLEYLHHSQSQCIIHRDLKPANVLIDDDMEARIADFGLAKALPEQQTHVTSSNVVGTLGYIAPEYHQTLKFTDKCDIFSFGVLLASLLVGHLPSDEFFMQTEELSLVKWLKNVLASPDPRRAIQEVLRGEEAEEEQMLLVLKIACFCTLDDPKQRPNSKDVVRMLRQVRKSDPVTPSTMTTASSPSAENSGSTAGM